MLARVGQCALKSSLSQSRRLQQRKISIVVHGGAWAIPDPIYEASQAGVEEAAALGFAVLQGGGSAVDAVQVRALAEHHVQCYKLLLAASSLDMFFRVLFVVFGLNSPRFRYSWRVVPLIGCGGKFGNQSGF